MSQTLRDADLLPILVAYVRRDSALKRRVYDAVYERMLRYVVESPPPDCTEAAKVESACLIACQPGLSTTARI